MALKKQKAGAIINLAAPRQEARIIQLNAAGQFGIENLTTTIDVLLKVGDQIGELIKDGPTTVEGINLGLTVLDAAGKTEVYKAALQEVRDLTPAESKQLTEYFGFNFDIDNNELEAKIETLIGLLPRAYDLIVNGFGLYVEIRSVIGSFRKAA